MDGAEIGRLMASSSDAVYDYMTDMQFAVDPPMGVSITEVSSFDLHDNYAVLHLESRMDMQSSPVLMVDDRTFPDTAVCFQRYDELTRTVVIKPSEVVFEALSSPYAHIRILSDMRFLIASTGDFYRRYGDKVSIPDHNATVEEPVYPVGLTPTEEQRTAVEMVLSNPLTYVWGAPGTGKTQMVLATCIRTLIAAGHKVAVFAPTNNSVEQVLRGLLSAMDGVLPSVVRLGIPSRSFLREHPSMCEDRYAQNRLKACRSEIENLEEVLMERSADILYDRIDDIERLMGSMDVYEPESHRDLLRPYAHLLEPGQLDLLMNTTDPFEVCRMLRTILESRDRPVKDITEYSSWSDADIIDEILERRKESSMLSVHDPADIIGRVSVIAGTPLQFISRFRPKGSEDDGRPELDVDHIFLDEAGYSNLPQAMSLFTNGVPITFLGDHMQLPPVCEMDADVIRRGAVNRNSLRDAYLWDLSAIHAEMLFGLDEKGMREHYIHGAEPGFSLTKKADLASSRRFGSNLARVLDEYVYRNGLTGAIGRTLEMVYVDCVCDDRKERENRAEAEAIRRYIQSNGLSPEDTVVLTPYSGQVRMLRHILGNRYRDSVMTVHSSQGREWDTVVISIADGRIESRDVPLRFTSSSTDIGRKLINTAVSRAKKTLVVFCDVGFWRTLDDELVRGLIEAGAELPHPQSEKGKGVH